VFAIGQVSKMTGLSVRTLRYYDEIGLLKPSDYTEGHHRLYTEDDVTVLMKIVFLRELGFPLKKIKEHLEGETDWEAFLKAQYERLEREKKRIEHLMNGIETTLISYQMEGTIDWRKLLEIYRYGKAEGQRSLTPEEREIIGRLPRLEDRAPESGEWIRLYRQIKGLTQSHPPDSPDVQRVVAQIVSLSERMFGGDLEKMEKAWEMRKSPKPVYRFYPVDDEVIQFLDRAFEVYWRKRREKEDGRGHTSSN